MLRTAFFSRQTCRLSGPSAAASSVLACHQTQLLESQLFASSSSADRRSLKSPRKIESEDEATARQAEQTEKQQQQLRDRFAHENVRPMDDKQFQELQEQRRIEAERQKQHYARARADEMAKNGNAGSTAGVPFIVPEKPGSYEDPGRNLRVFSNTAKGMYIHFPNLLGAQAFLMNDLHVYFWGFALMFVGSQVYVRYKVAKRETAEQAKLGETLLDNRTRELLGDIENVRNKDPLRLEHEANVYHEQFWKNRAKAVSDARKDRRLMEITRGEMQGAARGTDMSEWLGAKHKDEEEREIARRTHDYIQGMHQHLKARRLL